MPAAVQTNPATAGTHSARFNGEILSLGSLAFLDVSFEYGLDEGGPYPYSTTPERKTEVGAFHAVVHSLIADTAYYFRAKGWDGIYTISITADNPYFAIDPPVGDVEVAPGGSLVVTIVVPEDVLYTCTIMVDDEWCGPGSYAWGTVSYGEYLWCAHAGTVTVTFTDATSDHTVLIHGEMCT